MKFTNEQIQKAMACKTAEELLALAKSEGIAMTKEEAEKYLAALKDGGLKLEDLDAVTGGLCTGEACGVNC